MTRRVLVLLIFMAVAMWTVGGRPGSTAQAAGGTTHLSATATAAPIATVVRETSIPLRAQLSRYKLLRQTRELLTVQTLPGSTILMRVYYPRTGGFKKWGKVGSNGRWQHAWIAHANYAGPAHILLLVLHLPAKRYYTIHFQVQ